MQILPVDVAFVGEPDLNFNPAGAGVGEIGITGVAAVANTVYHATGKRLRGLPLTPIDCLRSILLISSQLAS